MDDLEQTFDELFLDVEVIDDLEQAAWDRETDNTDAYVELDNL